MVEVFDGGKGVAKFLLFVDSDCILQAAEQAHGTAVNNHLLVPCHSAENLHSQYSTLSLTPHLPYIWNMRMKTIYHSCFWEQEIRVGGQQRNTCTLPPSPPKNLLDWSCCTTTEVFLA